MRPAGSGPARAGTSGGPREILFVELLGGFGDLLIALPAVHRLADSHPTARLRVLTFAPGGQLLARDPRVAEVIELTDHTGPALRRSVAAALARHPPDLAVTTTRHSGLPALLTAGTPGVAVTDLWRCPPADERVGDRYLDLLAADGWVDGTGRADGTGSGADPPAGDGGCADARPQPGRLALDPAELAAGQRLVDALTDGRRGPVLCVPDAGMAVKRWPADRWAALVQRLAAAGRPVLTSRAGPSPPAAASRALPPLSLRGLAAVCAAVGRRGGAVVGGDTGPVRLAAAVGTPTVGLFGPTLAARYGFGAGALAGGPATDLQGLPGCPVRRPAAITEQECWWTARCPLAADGPACLANLTVTDVIAALSL
ncbi:ADP-heptose:LPS heptosyltransferase [Frankia sp. EI5c]|uniref:glycosyltransferase family 9 protein n=1 Tax=Frankia sp. EI5c TaxID=683316 RepID=UPI0007C24688|nr:glycosyltransferase family 9 protein [Frankia sp. EI5c]OAA23351.1 ADP-heptose:LPS heptosyltransferase [Frankia sp. EI5c]